MATDSSVISTLAAKAETLRALHSGPHMLVLPNAWDAASARVFEEAGFPAIATTSGGVANALGFEDHEKAPADEMFAAAARITRAVAIPVSVDLEAGYRLSPRELAERAISTGCAGMNLEDTDHSGAAPLVDAERQAERLRAVKEAGRAVGVDFVLNARVDVLIHRLGSLQEQIAEACRRAKLYRDAGADCIYPFGFFDRDTVAALVAGIDGPINIVTSPRSLPLPTLAELGVRRVTFASGLFRDSVARLKEATAAIRETLPQP